MSDPRLVWVGAGQQTGPCRAATSGVVELREPQSVLGQTVEVGGFNFAAVAADVGPSHIIGHHDDYIWTALADRQCGAKKKQTKQGFNFHILERVQKGFLLARGGQSQYLRRVLEHGAVAKW